MHREVARYSARLILPLALLLAVLGASAQTPNNRLVRIQPIDQARGQFGLVLESKIRGRNYMNAHKGFYLREMVVSRISYRQARPSIFERLHKFILSDYQKYLVFYAGYQRDDLTDHRLLLRGPFAQAAVRRYFRHRGPEGCYLHLGVEYAAHFVRGYDEELRRTDPAFLIHAPGARLTTGWQFLLGHKRHWAIDLYAGGAWQQTMASKGPDHPAREALPTLRVVWGVGLGYAFHQRGKYY